MKKLFGIVLVVFFLMAIPCFAQEGINDQVSASDQVMSGISVPSALHDSIRLKGICTIDSWAPQEFQGIKAPCHMGQLSGENLIPTLGLNDILNVYYRDSTQRTTIYIGLCKNTPAMTPIAADTMSSIASGATQAVEASDYTGNRQAYVATAAASASITNAGANVATFPMLTTITVIGAFMSTAATTTSGILLNEKAFTTGLAVQSGYTLTVTWVITFTSS